MLSRLLEADPQGNGERRTDHDRGHEAVVELGKGTDVAKDQQAMTLPTKVPSDSLGRIGSLQRTSDKFLFPMALGSCGHRITHQLRPINMNGRSILSVTSAIASVASSLCPGQKKYRMSKP